MSDEPLECYNNIIWYIMQWVERETVNGERFFTELFRGKDSSGNAFCISLKTSEEQAAFARRQRPPSHHWCMDSPGAAKPWGDALKLFQS